MISIKDKKQCCACSACAQACPKQCIKMVWDNEGFLYPKIDTSVCVDCGLCEKVCPVLNQKETREPLEAIAAINPNEDIRRNSSSGGVFTLLAESVIEQGGIVFGARFDEQWQVVIDAAETIEQVESFRGSKYLQARVEDSYKRCKNELETGRQVLFSGTPCQIAGLYNYLRKTYNNLLTVDFVCHGVPSPGVWNKYLSEVVSSTQKAIVDVNFRDKPEGWRKFHLSLSFNEEKDTAKLSTWYNEDAYMRAFLSNMILRPSCYACPTKSGKSHSDLTIADFWGIEKILPELDDDKGVSLVFVNTERGRMTLDLDKLLFRKVQYKDVIPSNPSITTSSREHRQRSRFFKAWQKKTNLIDWINTCQNPSYFHKAWALLWSGDILKKIQSGGGKLL